MSLGTKLMDAASAIGNHYAGAAESIGEKGAFTSSHENRLGTAYNAVKDNFFSGQATHMQAIGALGLGVAGVGAIAATDNLMENHPALGTGAIALGTALALSRPGSLRRFTGLAKDIGTTVE